MENIVINSGKKESEIGLVKKSLFYAMTSFLIGSILFTLFYWTEYIGIALFGFLFLIIAIVMNGTFLIKLTMKIYYEKTDKKKYLYPILILIINIPVAIIYFKIVMNIIFENVAMD